MVLITERSLMLLLSKIFSNLFCVLFCCHEMPKIEDTATLFTPFYRGSNIGNITGSGIGLSIVKRVLEYHKARVIYNIIDENTNQVHLSFSLLQDG
jgi:signal transduction histidine kinase